jgi:hypothetical protein
LVRRSARGSIFGYITAAVSSYFINKDASDERSPVASDQKLERVLSEVLSLRAELQELRMASALRPPMRLPQ